MADNDTIAAEAAVTALDTIAIRKLDRIIEECNEFFSWYESLAMDVADGGMDGCPWDGDTLFPDMPAAMRDFDGLESLARTLKVTIQQRLEI